MIFHVQGKEFAQQLQAVSKVINTKNAIQAYDNFLLRLEGDKLYITGSDQENYLTVAVDVMDASGDGEVAVGSRRLLEITKEVSAQPLEIEVDDDTFVVNLRFSSGVFQFPGIDGKEYPRKKAAEENEKIHFTLPAEVVRKGIESTLFAVSLDTIRPIMTGILWDVKPDRVIFVSSDTHKLVKYTNSQKEPGIEHSFIFPNKPASILRTIIKPDDTDIDIEVDDKSATIKFGNVELSSRLIKGNYPPYDRVIPKENPFHMTVSRESLLTATRRVSLFASQASNLVRMAISEDNIKVSSQDIDYSTEANENVPCQYEGNPMTIGFKAEYMKEVLSNLRGDEVRIELSDPARPGLFMPEDKMENEEIVMLQMPMQVFE
ncbi:MAG: DNA polymerase III subunit beta [Muribaculum sp.]|nr:DNA polymerase III subunit beta [Muribaculum sp.]